MRSGFVVEVCFDCCVCWFVFKEIIVLFFLPVVRFELRSRKCGQNGLFGLILVLFRYLVVRSHTINHDNCNSSTKTITNSSCINDWQQIVSLFNWGLQPDDDNSPLFDSPPESSSEPWQTAPPSPIMDSWLGSYSSSFSSQQQQLHRHRHEW